MGERNVREVWSFKIPLSVLSIVEVTLSDEGSPESTVFSEHERLCGQTCDSPNPSAHWLFWMSHEKDWQKTSWTHCRSQTASQTELGRWCWRLRCGTSAGGSWAYLVKRNEKTSKQNNNKKKNSVIKMVAFGLLVFSTIQKINSGRTNTLLKYF